MDLGSEAMICRPSDKGMGHRTVWLHARAAGPVPARAGRSLEPHRDANTLPQAGTSRGLADQPGSGRSAGAERPALKGIANTRSSAVTSTAASPLAGR